MRISFSFHVNQFNTTWFRAHRNLEFVRLRTKWLWVRVQLQSLKKTKLSFSKRNNAWNKWKDDSYSNILSETNKTFIFCVTWKKSLDFLTLSNNSMILFQIGSIYIILSGVDPGLILGCYKILQKKLNIEMM